jgi:hypothetical protein
MLASCMSYVLATGAAKAFNRQENAAMTLDGDELRISWGGSDEETSKRSGDQGKMSDERRARPFIVHHSSFIVPVTRCRT